SLMSIDDVLQLRDIKAFRSQQTRTLGLATCNWHTPGDEKFKSLVSELRLFFEDAHQHLGELEAMLPWHVAHGEGEWVARTALVSQIREQFVTHAIHFCEQIDAALRLAPPEHLPALKEFSIRQVHKYIQAAPCAHRALHKPLGYPGDYVFMRSCYE